MCYTVYCCLKHWQYRNGGFTETYWFRRWGCSIFWSAPSSLLVPSFRRLPPLWGAAQRSASPYILKQKIHQSYWFVSCIHHLFTKAHAQTNAHNQSGLNLYGCVSLLLLVGVRFYRSTVLETGFTLRGQPSTPFHSPGCCHSNRGGY